MRHIKLAPGMPNPAIGDLRYFCRVHPKATVHVAIVGFKRTLCGRMSDASTEPFDDLTRTFCRQCIDIIHNAEQQA